MKAARFFILASILFYGCATHQLYDTAQFRHREVQYKEITLDKEGLTPEQIKAISSTKPPRLFPVDISIILIKDSYIDSEVENAFTYNIVKELSKSKKIKRITLIPDFLIPNPIGFNSIQELGVRSLSEYVLIFDLKGREIFNWTLIIETKFEIKSSINFILVDSYTTAILTSDKLYSTQEYKEKIFRLKERREAQEIIFSEQGKLLAEKIDELFSGEK
ncbi:MAG: hypothetical protein JSU92_07390 [Deltaproteobacteria bacterium]|nr:MAG: hypothetical protein JSU92_07390 [Deltaproteobacteria bacterium]